MSGAAPGVRILPVRALNADGSGQSSDVAAGIVWAVQHGARVVNLSLGGGIPSDGMRDAIVYANSNNVLVVAAGGNGGAGTNGLTYPAAYEPAIAVVGGRLQPRPGILLDHGSYIDVAAPGVGVVSTYGSAANAYASSSGTSMATPYAVGRGRARGGREPGTDRSPRVRHARTRRRRSRRRRQGFRVRRGTREPARVGEPCARRGRRRRDRRATGSSAVTVGSQAFGTATHRGDLAGRQLSAPIVAAAATPSGNGYWLAGADGAVYAFGDAGYRGSMSGQALNGRIVGMAATPSGNGYVLLGCGRRHLHVRRRAASTDRPAACA